MSFKDLEVLGLFLVRSRLDGWVVIGSTRYGSKLSVTDCIPLIKMDSRKGCSSPLRHNFESYPRIIETREFMKLLSSDHESREVGSVDGEEDDSEHGPHIGHESRRETSRCVHMNGRLEENSPNQPVRAKQRKLAVTRWRNLKLMNKIWKYDRSFIMNRELR